MNRLLSIAVNQKKLEKIAYKLSKIVNVGDVLLLKGELGSGKTTFARFLITAIFKNNFFQPPEFIKSPSFPIMINYPLNNFEIYHYDLYRLKNIRELEEINIIENIERNFTIIEWPELIEKFKIIKNFFLINISIIDNEKRLIEVKHNKIKNI